MTDKATQVIAEALHDTMNEVVFGESNQDAMLRLSTAVLAALKQAGIAVVELSEPKPGYWDTYEEDGDDPDHNQFGESGEFAVTTWHGHPGEVQISHQGEPLEPVTPADARSFAAALLAAADSAEENQT